MRPSAAEKFIALSKVGFGVAVTSFTSCLIVLASLPDACDYRGLFNVHVDITRSLLAISVVTALGSAAWFVLLTNYHERSEIKNKDYYPPILLREKAYECAVRFLVYFCVVAVLCNLIRFGLNIISLISNFDVPSGDMPIFDQVCKK